MRGPCVAALLERALTASASAAGVQLHFASFRSTRWESATFSGARHTIAIRAAGGATLDRWLAALPDGDLPLGGHLVADIAVAETLRETGDVGVRIEALTVASG